PRENPSLFRYEELEDAKLHSGQLHLLSSGTYLVPLKVYAQQAAYLYLLCLVPLGAASSQDRFDARHELLGRKGLGDIVVGAYLESEHPIHLIGPGGDHDHRYGREALLLPQGLTDLYAVSVRQHQVEENEVRYIFTQEMIEGVKAGKEAHLH